MRRVWLSLAGAIRRFHFLIIAVALAATVVLALGVPRIRFKTGQDAFLPASSKVYQDNLRYQGQFGGDPMLVLFQGDVLQLLSSPNAETLRQIEQKLGADSRYFSIVSPLTVVQLGIEQMKVQQEAALSQLTDRQARAAEEARQSVAAQGGSAAAQEAAAQAAMSTAAQEFLTEQGPDTQRFAQVGEISPDNPKLAEFVLFDADGNVRPEMADIVPDRYHSLMVVRLAGNMSMDEQA